MKYFVPSPDMFAWQDEVQSFNHESMEHNAAVEVTYDHFDDCLF